MCFFFNKFKSMLEAAVAVLFLDYIFSSTKNRLCCIIVVFFIRNCELINILIKIQIVFFVSVYIVTQFSSFFTPLWSIVVWVANNLKISEILAMTTMIETMMTMTMTVMMTTMIMMNTRR